ncbi:hypothetical protein BKA62DRAFT_774105 [Auriculariales sp. MPI-PUGE-AT-0066]|nr:hypothetical protein BKA62DRAFT_774105 [Auriculariales sp. MPI-PUGE-AT-0066]
MGNACSRLSIPEFPAMNATTSSVLAALNTSLVQAFGEAVSLDRELIAELYCATTRDGAQCYGICPNADLAGLGVRLAFYFQAALNTCLVALSPEDSPGAAWGATLLTAAIIVPAMVQKKQLQLSLYHATLVLNFATLSSLASLAVAPLCPIWREKGMVVPLQQRLQEQLEGRGSHQLENAAQEPEFKDEFIAPMDEPNTLRSEKEITYQRIVLSVALLAQVALQWSYAILLFTSPYFAERSCSSSTVVVLFGIPLTAEAINRKYFFVWLLWLLFNMAATFIGGVVLVLSGSDSDRPQRQPTSRFSKFFQGGRGRKVIMYTELILAVGFLTVAEEQNLSNCFVSSSENSDWSFGQVAALLLVLVPIWQLAVVANNRWFGGTQPRHVLSQHGSRSNLGLTASPEHLDRPLSDDVSSTASQIRPPSPMPRAATAYHAPPEQMFAPPPAAGATTALFLSASNTTLRNRS